MESGTGPPLESDPFVRAAPNPTTLETDRVVELFERTRNAAVRWDDTVNRSTHFDHVVRSVSVLGS